MAKKKLYKSKSNFTLKRLHQSGSYGKIFERDYTTIPDTTSYSDSQITTYSSPTFKLSVGKNYNTQKKYKYGEWLMNPSECATNPELWTLGCLPPIRKQANKIVLKPHKRRLTDYVCYGSAMDLIRASISHIIEYFPGELFTSTGTFNEEAIISNPFEINLINAVMPEGENPLRYMCACYTEKDDKKVWDYVFIDGTEEVEINDWSVSNIKDKGCLNDGDKLAVIKLGGKTINAWYNQGQVIYTGDIGRVRPKKEIIEKFFEEIGDFERALLDRESGYAAIFETYTENEQDGWRMSEKTYKWPTDQRYPKSETNKWNLATSGKGFEDYMSDLLELALGYDTLFTDNIWRSMTHEAIANLDLTFTRNGSDVSLSDGVKMRKVMSIVGRQFDEIKKYADNITNTNSVSYDENGNLPDYFLSDALDLAGWEPKELMVDVSGDLVTEPLYQGAKYRGYTVKETSEAFMRRLKLNSKYIFAQKGTKRGIEDLLAHFGYHSVDWIKKYNAQNSASVQRAGTSNPYEFSFLMQEFVYVSDGYSNGKTKDEMLEKTAEYNAYRDSLINENSENLDYVYDPYEGLPVGYTYNDKGEACLVPWFDKSIKYDGDVYFQMNGGWGFYFKTGEDQTATETYDRTISKIHFCNTTEELYATPPYVLSQNEAYYVKENDSYYKLLDVTQSYNSKGWVLYPSDELERILNIQDNTKGNNPHIDPKKPYDDGVEYANMYDSIFKYSEFSNLRAEDIEKALELGFMIRREEDNMKCKYFKTYNDNHNDPARLRNGNLNPSTFWGDDQHGEYGALSVLNNKIFRIIFDITHKDFVMTEILPYLKQMIPSTAIFSYGFQTLGENVNIVEEAKVVGLVPCENNVCPLYGIV